MPNPGLSKGPVLSNFLLNPLFKKDRLSPSGFMTLLLGVLLIICSARPAPAQTAGTITGTVVDQSGAVIPEATVTITNSGTGVVARTLKTSAAGTYVAEALPVGTYQISVEVTGFQRAVDRKSTRLNSSHGYISYAVFCLKKKKIKSIIPY